MKPLLSPMIAVYVATTNGFLLTLTAGLVYIKTAIQGYRFWDLWMGQNLLSQRFMCLNNTNTKAELSTISRLNHLDTSITCCCHEAVSASQRGQRWDSAKAFLLFPFGPSPLQEYWQNILFCYMRWLEYIVEALQELAELCMGVCFLKHLSKLYLKSNTPIKYFKKGIRTVW